MFISRKNRGRERVTKLNREERTPSWLEPGWGHDIHSPSKWNSDVEKLQLSPFTSHRLPVNQGGQSCVFRGSLSQGHGIACPLPATNSSHAGWGLQLPFTATDMANEPDATGNPPVALIYSRAKGEDSVSIVPRETLHWLQRAWGVWHPSSKPSQILCRAQNLASTNLPYFAQECEKMDE